MKIGSLLSKRSALTRPPVIIGASIAAAVVLALVVKAFLGGGEGDAGERATFTVKRGPLAVKIVQTGELQAAESIRIIPEIRGQATIVSMVDEGTRVKKGDVIAQLDSSTLEETEADQAIEVENANANLVRTREERKIQELENETKIAGARLAVETARMDLDKYGAVMLTPDGFLDMRYYPDDSTAGVESTDSALELESTGPGQDAAGPDAPDSAPALESTDSAALESTEPASLESTDAVAGRVERGEAYQAFRDAELAIERASTDLTKAKMDFNKMDELLEKGFVTRNDYLEDELKVTEAERKLESTRLDHFILRTYEHPKSLAKFRAELKKAEDELKQTELSAAAQLAQKDAAITQAQAVHEMRTKSLADTRDRIAKMIIVAPDDGLVLYGDERRPWDKENIKVGGRATEGSPLITFPSVGRMVAATKVPEKDIYRVRPGMTVIVTAPALTDAVFTGKVSKISSVASTSNRWMAASESKVFDVEIPIDQADDRVKPGMSCQAEILIATLPDCLYVPVNCVFRQEGRDMCTVTSVGGMTSRAVTLGDTNDIYVQVVDGLEEGDRVLLYSVAPSEVSVGASSSQAGKPGEAGAPQAGQATAPGAAGDLPVESSDSAGARGGRRRMGGDGLPMESSDSAGAFPRSGDGGMRPQGPDGMGPQGPDGMGPQGAEGAPPEGAPRRGGRGMRRGGEGGRAPAEGGGGGSAGPMPGGR